MATIRRDIGDRIQYYDDKIVRNGRFVNGALNNATVFYKNGFVHRDDGPAVEYTTGYHKGEIYWWVNGYNIDNCDVDTWIKENNYPHWDQWDDNIKLHFKLTFE